MGRAPFSHFVVTQGGKPCVLVKHPPLAPEGVLLVANGHQPTRFLCEREALNNPKFATVYARRRAVRAIHRTEEFITVSKHSLANTHPFVKAVCDVRGEWDIEPVKILKAKVET